MLSLDIPKISLTIKLLNDMAAKNQDLRDHLNNIHRVIYLNNFDSSRKWTPLLKERSKLPKAYETRVPDWYWISHERGWGILPKSNWKNSIISQFNPEERVILSTQIIWKKTAEELIEVIGYLPLF
jgi:hypothetical protein